jgi:hypothetical protein
MTEAESVTRSGLRPAYAATRAHLGIVAVLFALAAIGWWWTVGEMRGMGNGRWTALGGGRVPHGTGNGAWSAGCCWALMASLFRGVSWRRTEPPSSWWCSASSCSLPPTRCPRPPFRAGARCTRCHRWGLDRTTPAGSRTEQATTRRSREDLRPAGISRPLCRRDGAPARRMSVHVPLPTRGGRKDAPQAARLVETKRLKPSS